MKMKSLWTGLVIAASVMTYSTSVQATADFHQDVLSLENKNYKVIRVDTISKDGDATAEIQKALDEVKDSKVPIKVIVKEGKYRLSAALVIRSNTWLQTSKNTVFTRPAGFKNIMLLNADPDRRNPDERIGSGYRGNSNIIIDGGIWDSNGGAVDKNGEVNRGLASGFGLALGENILVQNVTIKNMVNSHAIDLVGDKNVVIRNSKFLGYKDTTIEQNRGYAEMIQVDGHITNMSFGIFGPYTGKEVRNGNTVYLGDNTVTESLWVENNYFGKSDTATMNAPAVGIGSHSAADGKPFKNIYILNNTFEGMTFAGIHTYHWNGVTIKSNHFIGTEKGIWVDHTTKEKSTTGESEIRYKPSSGFYILSNDFKNIKDVAIHLDGEKTPKRKGLDDISPIQNVQVLTNTFDTGEKTKKIRISDTDNLKTDLGVYYLVSTPIKGGNKTKDAAESIQSLLKNGNSGELNAKVSYKILKLEDIYRVKTTGYKTKSEAVKILKKIKKEGNLPSIGMVTKENGKYYGNSYGLVYPDVKKLSDNVNKLYSLKTTVIKTEKQTATDEMTIGPFISQDEALKSIQMLKLSQYEWKYNVQLIIK